MNLPERAFDDLMDRIPPLDLSVSYSGRFKGYNANLKYTNKRMIFNLSSSWKRIDEDIQIGLLQHLIAKVYRTKKKTYSMDLYENFLKNVHIAVPKNRQEPELKRIFDRLNEQFFSGLLEECNLVWGHNSIRTFGSYEYGTDTITMNTALRDHPDLLSYVVFHEMLHKRLKFKGRRHHTKEFRILERSYPGSDILEKKLSALSKKLRFQSLW